MKYVYVTVDIEEWYDLEYLKGYDLKSKGVEVVPKIIDFLDLLDRLDVKATFFVIGDLVEKNADIICEIASRGHALGCHGFDHRLLNEKTNVEFVEEIIKAKTLIENITGCPVNGYRAPCFSLERDKLECVKSAGYALDSSRIRFRQHPLYCNLDLTGFIKVDDMVYIQEEFFEYEIPTIQIGKFDIPISGGGYLRLLPFSAIKWLIKRYSKTHENFLIYVHPFELTDVSLPLPKEISFKNRFRVSVGRKKNLRKMSKLLVMLKEMNAEFRTLPQDRELRLKV